MEINNKNTFPCKFPKKIKGPSFQENSKLLELLISVIKTGDFFIRFFTKTLENRKNKKNEKCKSCVLDGPSNPN